MWVIFFLKIVQGQAGATGPRGTSGPQGQRGEPGRQGSSGPQGNQVQSYLSYILLSNDSCIQLFP